MVELLFFAFQFLKQLMFTRTDSNYTYLYFFGVKNVNFSWTPQSNQGNATLINKIILLQVSACLTEAVVQRCSVKEVFLEILQNSQENTSARISFLIKLETWGLQLY